MSSKSEKKQSVISTEEDIKKNKASQSTVKKTTSIEQLDFDSVNAVNDALFYAFHPTMFDEEIDEDNLTDEQKVEVAARETKYFAIWETFLALSGWDDTTYWLEVEQRKTICPNCGSLKQHSDEELEEDIDLDLPTAKIEGVNKPN